MSARALAKHCAGSSSAIVTTRQIQTDAQKTPAISEAVGSSDDDRHQGIPVTLHIYDIGNVLQWANNALLREKQLGLYHAGIEVCGTEWSYQTVQDCWDDETMTGVVACEPGKNTDFVWKERVHLGLTPLDSVGIELVRERMSETWTVQSYHLTDKNCIHFAQMFAQNLLVADGFDWSILYGLAGYVNSSSILKPMADSLWESIRSIRSTWDRQQHEEEERHRRTIEMRRARRTPVEDLRVGQVGRGTQIFFPDGLLFQRRRKRALRGAASSR